MSKNSCIVQAVKNEEYVNVSLFTCVLYFPSVMLKEEKVRLLAKC